METIRKIKITEIVGDVICVASEDGEAVYNELYTALDEGCPVMGDQDQCALKSLQLLIQQLDSRFVQIRRRFIRRKGQLIGRIFL